MTIPLDDPTDTPVMGEEPPRSARRLLLIVVIAILFVIFECYALLLPVPTAVFLFIAWAACAYHAEQFTRHYLYLKSGFPVKPREAEEFREELQPGLIATAWLVPLLFPLYALRGLLYLPLCVDATRQWLCQNAAGRSGPGVFQSPAGDAGTRAVTSGVAVAAVGFWVAAAAGGRFLPENPTAAAPLAVLLLLPFAYAALHLAWYLPRLRWLSYDIEGRILHMRHSPVRAEREGVWCGFNITAGTPAIIPLDACFEHMYLRGSPGSGKTRKICELLTQAVSFGDFSIVVIDMKGDDTVMLGTLHAAAKRLRKQLKVKVFYDRVGYASHTLSLFEQRFWADLTPAQQAALVAKAAGGTQGMVGHGPQWYQGAYFELLRHNFERHADSIRSFKGLSEAVFALSTKKAESDIPHDVRQAGLQAWLDTRRLAGVEPLNVCGNTQGIDLCALFEEPQVLYFRLHSAIMGDLAGMVFRLLLHGIFDFAAHVRRKNRVLVVADEFQRGIGPGLEEVFQQARSCGIGLLLANQSLQALAGEHHDFTDLVLNACRVQWAFDITNPAEVKLFSETGGKMISYRYSFSQTWGLVRTSTGYERKKIASTSTAHEVEVDEVSIDRVLSTSADPIGSFLWFNRDTDEVKWHRRPQEVVCPFIITKEEHESRLAVPWPEPADGAIVVRRPAPVVAVPPELKSVVTERETIARPKASRNPPGKHK